MRVCGVQAPLHLVAHPVTSWLSHIEIVSPGKGYSGALYACVHTPKACVHTYAMQPTQAPVLGWWTAQVAAQMEYGVASEPACGTWGGEGSWMSMAIAGLLGC
jgi:hypothetical protein